MSRNFLLTLGISALSAFSMFADNDGSIVDFSYAQTGQQILGYGYSRTDTYEICMLVKDSGLAGGKLKTMSVPVPAAGGCSIDPNVKVWVTDKLTSDPLENESLIYSVDVTSDGQTINAQFPDGIILPVEGVYVGYTVTVTELPSGYRKYPMAVVEGSTPGSLYFRTPATQTKWDETFNRAEYMSAMTVGIEKEIREVSVYPSLPTDYRVAKNSEASYPVTLINRGQSPIKDFSYILSVGADEYQGKIELSATPDSEFKYGDETHVEIPFKSPDIIGTFPVSVEIAEVNGRKNEGDPASSAAGNLIVAPFVPKYLPLVDEFTGFSCGNCPAGWVAMEESKDLYGSDFVFICYHSADMLTSGVRPPYNPPYVPALSINRAYPSPTVNEVYEVFPGIFNTPTDAGLKINLYWTDRTKSALQADVDVCFMKSQSATNYDLKLILVADGLSNPSWAQDNYFSGATGKTGKYWQIFTQGGGKIYGLEYNSVPAIDIQYDELDGTIPSSVKELELYNLKGVFDLKYGVSSRGVNLVENKNKLRVIAILTNSKTGEFINCISSGYSADAPLVEEAGMNSALVDSEIASIIYYSIDGKKMSEASKGEPCIKVITLSDGRVMTEKVIEK